MTHSQQGAECPDAPGAVVASEAALEALRGTRPWAMGLAALLLAYTAAGGAAGVLWLIDLAAGVAAGRPPVRPYITAASVNLLFAPVALAGGVLAMSYSSAVGRAVTRLSSDDLERASVALNRLWLWAGVAVAVLVGFLASMAVAAALTGEFPG